MNVADLEEKFGLTATDAAAILGVDRRRYHEFKSGRVKTPPYILASVRAHCALPRIAFEPIRKEALSAPGQ